LVDEDGVECWGLLSGTKDDFGLPGGASVSTWMDVVCVAGGDESQCAGGDEDEWGVVSEAPRDLLSVSVGARFACGIDKRSALQCWGFLPEGVPGTDSDSDWLHVHASAFGACVVSQDGNVECWGDEPYPPGEAGPTGLIRVAAGFGYACGLTMGGSVECWGDAPVPTGMTGTDVDATGSQACVLDGAVAQCWGESANNHGMDEVRSFDTQVEEFAAGSTHACIMDRSGEVSCWGSDLFGESSPP